MLGNFLKNYCGFHVGWWISSIFSKYIWTLFWDLIKLLGNILILLRLAFKLCYAGTEYPLVQAQIGPNTKEIAFWELYQKPCVLEGLPTLVGMNMNLYRPCVNLEIKNYSFYSFSVVPSQALGGLLTCICWSVLGPRFKGNFLKLSRPHSPTLQVSAAFYSAPHLVNSSLFELYELSFLPTLLKKDYQSLCRFLFLCSVAWKCSSVSKLRHHRAPLICLPSLRNFYRVLL